MVDQATLDRTGRRNGQEEFPPRAAVRNMADLLHDVTVLAELQSRLFVADCRAATRRVALPAIVAVAAAVLAACTIPVFLAAIAYAFVEGLDWPRWAGFLLTGVIFLLLSGIALAVAYARLRTSLEPLQRSRHELDQNIAWIKAALRQKGTRVSPRC